MNTFKVYALTGAMLFASPIVGQAQDVVIVPEQETVIREYVRTQPAFSLELPGVELNIGSTVPETVEVREIPDVEYRYFATGGKTYVVEPGTRRIVHVIE